MQEQGQTVIFTVKQRFVQLYGVISLMHSCLLICSCHDNLFSSFTGVKCTSLHIVFPPILMGKINVLWVIKKATLMSAWLFSSVFFFCVWVANLRWLPLHRDLLGCIILLDCSSLQWNAVFKNKLNLWLSSAVPLTPEVRKQALYAMRFVVTWGMLRTSVQHSSWL